jgi:hypothetical protein
VEEFEDFTLSLEVKVPPDSNSGVYLRGVYEVQIADTYQQRPTTRSMGAIYSRIAPTESAEKPPGVWQRLSITLVERHVTVVLNDQVVIDNQPLPGITGGALWANELRPGPIYLQGDHGPVEFRNLVLWPLTVSTSPQLKPR